MLLFLPEIIGGGERGKDREGGSEALLVEDLKEESVSQAFVL